MSTIDFRPSDIALCMPPLVGTMQRAKREFAAALIVRACQVLGDEWKPVTIDELETVIKADLAAQREPLASLARNPFFRPNFAMLADGVYGRWTGEPGTSGIELTELGLEALRRWVVVP